MAVSVGFSQHIVNLLDWFGLHPDPRWISPAYLPGGLVDLEGITLYAPGWHLGFNWPAFIIVMLLTMILVRGIRESAETNNVMVLLKIMAILVFITFASRFIHPANWHPFAPNGWPGILTGGSIVFFHLYWIRFRFPPPPKNARTRNAMFLSALWPPLRSAQFCTSALSSF